MLRRINPVLARCYTVCLASEYHGLTLNIIKSVNFRVYPLQIKISIRCNKEGLASEYHGLTRI